MKPETRNQKLKSRREQIILYAPLFIWIGVIFFLSSGQGASARTSLVIRPILEFLFPNASFETISFYHGIIRKFAHFGEYGVLGFLACRAFVSSQRDSIRRFFFLFAVALVLAVAATDEFNQSFEISRTSSGWDVLLDLAGGVVMSAVFWLTQKKRTASPENRL